MDKIDKYIELIRKYPQYFEINNSFIELITDKNEMIKYINDYQIDIGLIYESSFHIFVVDLLKDTSGHMFTHDRIIQLENAVVIIPKYHEQYFLLKQYRYTLNKEQYAFPRGFGEKDLDAKTNAIKEITEELDVEVIDIYELSTIVPDSGLSGNKVHVFVVEVDNYQIKVGYEGISNVLIVTEEELKLMIRNHEINDSFTLSSLMLYWNEAII